MFFTAVNPTDIREHWQTEFDMTKPRIAEHRQKCKEHRNTVYRVNGLVAGGKDAQKGRQAVFFTAVKPMESKDHWQTEFDMTKPRVAIHIQKLGRYSRTTVYWVNLKIAQRRGLLFFQTRSNAIILYNTLTPCCIEKKVLWKTAEVLYDQVYRSPRSPVKLTLKPAWTKRRSDTSNSEAR